MGTWTRLSAPSLGTGSVTGAEGFLVASPQCACLSSHKPQGGCPVALVHSGQPRFSFYHPPRDSICLAPKWDLLIPICHVSSFMIWWSLSSKQHLERMGQTCFEQHKSAVFFFLSFYLGHTVKHVGSYSQPGTEPLSPALEPWSLNHWTFREVPVVSLFCLRAWLADSFAGYWILDGNSRLEIISFKGIGLLSSSFQGCLWEVWKHFDS